MTESIAIPLLIVFFSFTLTVLAERVLIPLLSRCAKQPIYDGGPVWHLSKSGTPTMGGIAFIAVATPTLAVLSSYLFSANLRNSAISLLFAMLFAILNAAVGVIDDLTKLRNKRNAGLTPVQKLILQFAIAVLYVILLARFDSPNISNFRFLGINLGMIYYPAMTVMLVGLVNFANLTDGVDGLASSVALAIAISLIVITKNEIPELSFACLTLIGICAGFLIFNFHPAKIFMGDTGSLFLGALIAAMSTSLRNPLMILLISGVYVIEGASVILQVAFFKMTKKRLFKMAPLHHHFEKSGFSEVKICVLAVLATILFSSIAYFLELRL